MVTAALKPSSGTRWRIERARHQWGDYFDALAHGEAARAPDGSLFVDRTGPFVPPISLPLQHVVVTAKFRAELEAERFTGMRFTKVRLRRIVKLDWQLWDRAAAEPAIYPSGGEPDLYIYGRKNQPALHPMVGELWELDLTAVKTGDALRHDLHTDGKMTPTVLASERAGCFLIKHAGEWVSRVRFRR